DPPAPERAVVRALDQHPRGIRARHPQRLREVGPHRRGVGRAGRLMRTEPLPASSAGPNSRGINLFAADPGFHDFLELYIEEKLFEHLKPHFRRLGALAGSELDALAT